MSADLLFELGCEEIPAKMLANALAALPGQVTAKLAAARLTHGAIKVLGTPRRLAVIVMDLADRQPDLDEQVVGPPVGAAFAPDGTLSKAGEGFAKKNGVGPEAITKQEVAGKKGLYAVAQKHVTGEATRALLPQILIELAGGIAWPKSMKWGWSEITFVRPVQWLVALYGGEVVPFEWAGQVAGRQTRGHRFLSSGVHDLANAGAYIPTLRAAKVIVDPAERAQRVREELARLARENHLVMRPDEALIAEVTNLGEWPVGIAGEFDATFLEVPEEMIVTSMRTHQRYFAFEDANGHLQNHFATLAATHVKDPKVVAEGNQKVLASRLTDAMFFFAEDKKHTMDDWNRTLDSVVFQAKLPETARTVGDKIRRITAIATALVDSPDVRTTAMYCKADLASKAVGEFPELQGTMGKHYALHHGLGDEVARSIEQHWWPKGQGAALPTTTAAVVTALADRMDTILACFSAELEPTGNADPFGLRRAAIGIWQLLLKNRPTTFTRLVDVATRELQQQGVRPPHPGIVNEFFVARLRGIFVEQGIPAQDVNAALAQGWQDPGDALARAKACARISKDAREVFKRVANILDDARQKKLSLPGAVDEQLFSRENTVEQNLYKGIRGAAEREITARISGDYEAMFESLEQLRPTVAAFFDKGGVMVMDPDPKLRDNRLALLELLIAPYAKIADFRKLGGNQ